MYHNMICCVFLNEKALTLLHYAGEHTNAEKVLDLDTSTVIAAEFYRASTLKVILWVKFSQICQSDKLPIR